MPNALLARLKMTRRYKKYPPLTRAQQKLVEEHRWIAGRLAYSAICFTGSTTGSLTRDDLESVALFALCVAATRYAPEMGVKYSTYAWNTARGYIQHALRDFSRMVRTPRWIGEYKKRVDVLIKEGKSYEEISDELGIDRSRVMMCEQSSFNYHISYDNQPEDWATKEFIFDFDEAKSTLLSPELVSEIRDLSDAEMTMLMRFIGEEETSEEEREWASEKFFQLKGIAYGSAEEV